MRRRDILAPVLKYRAGLVALSDAGAHLVFRPIDEISAFTDLLLFDTATVGVSAARRVNDLPAQ